MITRDDAKVIWGSIHDRKDNVCACHRGENKTAMQKISSH